MGAEDEEGFMENSRGADSVPDSLLEAIATAMMEAELARQRAKTLVEAAVLLYAISPELRFKLMAQIREERGENS